MRPPIAHPKPTPHQNFIDWMKAVGMFFIVFGHVVGDPFNQFTQPVYPKQLGVAFFVFAMGWSLANDHRAGLRLVFSRLFPVYFWGISFALLLSAVFLITKGNANLSNYEPFVLGGNVILNSFPANPTTWYIGTYLHLLLFWTFFLQGKPLKARHIFAAFVMELLCRALLLGTGRLFTTYMLLPNWLTVFLLGIYLRRHRDMGNKTKAPLLIAAWLALFAFWAMAGNHLGFGPDFPFRSFAGEVAFPLLFLSLLISLVYILHTLLFFHIARRLPAWPAVSFFARNTLIIFIAHMPIIYAAAPSIYRLFDSVILKKSILILLLYLGLALVSELLHKTISIKLLREKTWSALAKRLPAPPQTQQTQQPQRTQ
ncbi:MAG: acyltransferase [Thermodesulfobacteriota bacterium]